jgi:oxaloacetate decarboxylase alpha subunit
MKFVYRRQATDAETVEVEVVPLANRDTYYRVTVRDQVFELSSRLLQRVAWLKEGGEITLQYEGREYHLFDASQRQRPALTPAGDLRAPMAGKIIRVYVHPGDHVKAGDVLLILEAMKMEQQITAPQDGVVARLLCREGEQVATGTELVVLEPASTTPPEPQEG